MAKMGIGGLLLGAAALAAASAATSNSGSVKHGKYDTKYDVNGRELSNSEKMIKSIIHHWTTGSVRIPYDLQFMSGSLQQSIEELKECVNDDGHIDDDKASMPLIMYLCVLNMNQILYHEGFTSDYTSDLTPKQKERLILVNDLLSKSFEKEIEEMKEEGIRTPSMGVKHLLSKIKTCIDYDIYGNDLPEYERKAKIAVYWGGYYKRSKLERRFSSEMEYEMAYLLHNCIKDNGRVDMTKFDQAYEIYECIKKQGG